MVKRKTKALTPQVMPKQDAHAERVVNFHLAGKAHASAAVFCAAAAGAVMLQKKKELGHGKGFQDWKKNLCLPDGTPISLRTADNYLALAKQMVERIKALPKTQRVAFLPPGANTKAIAKADAATSMVETLASFDPAKTEELRQQALESALQEITAGQFLTQLYFDWGIMRPPKTGYQKHHPTTKTPDELYQEAVEATWRELEQQLVNEGLQSKTYAFLNRDDIERIQGVLIDVNRNLREALKK